MSLRSTYLAINLFALVLLSAGLFFLWQDKKLLLQQDQDFTTKKLNTTLTFIKTINSLENYLDQNSPKKASAYKRQTLQGLSQFSSNFIGEEKQNERSSKRVTVIIEDMSRIEDLRREKIEKDSDIDLLEKSILELQKKIEETLSQMAKDLMTNQRQLAPELKKTLGAWVSTFPFLENLKKKIDLNYLKDEDISELNRLLNFTSWFSQQIKFFQDQKRLKRQDLSRLFLETNRRLDEVHNSPFETPAKIQAIYLNKEIRKLYDLWEKKSELISKRDQIKQKLMEVIKKVREEDEKELISLWQKNYLNKTREKTLAQEKHFSVIINSALLVVGLIIMFSLFIFLKIFPHLKQLEKKADAMAAGNFTTSFEKIPKNEIGTLMKSFNKMSSQISDYLFKISEEEKEKAKLAQAVQEMRHLSEMGEAAAKVAHDLKNPISILKLCLNDIKDHLKSEASSISSVDLQHRIRPDVDKSLMAVEKLILASEKLSSNRRKSSKEEIEVSKLLQDTLSLFEARLEALNIESEIIIENTVADSTLRLAKLEFMGVLSNLIVNAIEYYENRESDPRKIILHAKIHEGNFIITVANYGDKIERPQEIFNNFYSSKEGPLRGLGLSIVEDFMKENNGKVTYDYRSDQNCFNLLFPVKETSC
jgi:nitrogen fixation/metabolism regulation signal transduction histidine kinase